MKGVFIYDNIVIRWVFATWVLRASGRLYPTLELELGIGDLGIPYPNRPRVKIYKMDC